MDKITENLVENETYSQKDEDFYYHKEKEATKDQDPISDDDIGKPTSLQEFLLRIGMEDFIKRFEYEMIDLEILQDMSHEDLASVGVKRFGQRRKIVKEIGYLSP